MKNNHSAQEAERDSVTNAENNSAKTQKAPYFTAKRVAVFGVMTALSVVTNIVSIPITGSNYLSFAYVPCVLAGMFLGIPGGFLVGLLGDVIGCIVAPHGAWLPLITLASTLLGGIPGIITYLAKKRMPDILERRLERNLLLWLNLIVILFVCTAGINTYALFLAYSKGKTFWAYLGVRLPFQFLMLFANGVVMTAIINIPEIRKLLDVTRQ